MSKLSQVTLCRTESGHHQVRTEPYAMVAAVNAACSLQESMLAAVVQDGAVLHFVTSTRYSVGLKSVSFFQERQGGAGAWCSPPWLRKGTRCGTGYILRGSLGHM